MGVSCVVPNEIIDASYFRACIKQIIAYDMYALMNFDQRSAIGVLPSTDLFKTSGRREGIIKERIHINDYTTD